MKRTNKLIALTLGMVIALAGQALVWGIVAQSTASPPAVRAAGPDYPNCRLGVGVLRNPITTYAIAPMRFGWYVNWSASLNPIRPAGMDFYFTIRVKQHKSGSTYLPSYETSPALNFTPGGAGEMVQANPGGTWIIGNEPDRPYSQDDVMPEMYAQIYHDAYTFIKAIDPTAKVAIGPIVQPTPLRLQYLDRVLNAHRSMFGVNLPVDIFNTHAYMIDEIKNGPGAEIPPGITATLGTQFTEAQHLDVNVFGSLIRDLRGWMKARGYRDKPLIVTEYGALYPLWYLDDFGLTQGHINAYISNVINWVNTTTDASTGYAPDANHLVQQAALYSLDDDSVFPTYAGTSSLDVVDNPLQRRLGAQTEDEILYRWGSFLFRSTPPYTLTASGAGYSATVSSLTAAVDLWPYRAATQPGAMIVQPSQSITPTVQVLVANSGNAAPPISVTVRFRDVTGGGSTLLGNTVLPAFTGCGTLREASIVWPNLTPGVHELRVEIDPAGQIVETHETNNVMTATFLVGTYGTYLPTIRK